MIYEIFIKYSRVYNMKFNEAESVKDFSRTWWMNNTRAVSVLHRAPVECKLVFTINSIGRRINSGC